MEQNDIYDKLSREDQENRNMMHYNVRKSIEDGRGNPCDKNVIKMQGYHCQQAHQEEPSDTSEKTTTEKSYEDIVNEILEEFCIDGQECVNDLVAREKNLHKILKENDNQTRVQKIVKDNER